MPIEREHGEGSGYGQRLKAKGVMEALSK